MQLLIIITSGNGRIAQKATINLKANNAGIIAALDAPFKLQATQVEDNL